MLIRGISIDTIALESRPHEINTMILCFRMKVYKSKWIEISLGKYESWKFLSIHWLWISVILDGWGYKKVFNVIQCRQGIYFSTGTVAWFLLYIKPSPRSYYVWEKCRTIHIFKKRIFIKYHSSAPSSMISSFSLCNNTFLVIYMDVRN